LAKKIWTGFDSCNGPAVGFSLVPTGNSQFNQIRFRSASLLCKKNIPKENQFVCPTNEFLIGYKIRLESGYIVNLQMKCSDGKILKAQGYARGSWLDWKYCPTGKYIFGMSKLIRPRNNKNSMENFKFECRKPNQTSQGQNQCDSIVLSGTCVQQTANAPSLFFIL
jgi:hypothetical protein